MPPEYFLGIAVAVILAVLLGMLLQRWLGTRFVVLRKSSGTDQLANQLARIADSLDKIVAYAGTSAPPVEKVSLEKPPAETPPAPAQKLSDPTAADQPKADQSKAEKPAEHHVTLSMFGR